MWNHEEAKRMRADIVYSLETLALPGGLSTEQAERLADTLVGMMDRIVDLEKALDALIARCGDG